MKTTLLLRILFPALSFFIIDPCFSQSCVASFTTNQTLPNVVNFTSTSTGTNVNTVYQWSFGDSQFGSGQNTAHTYVNPGWYYVCLTIYDSLSCQSTYCDTVVVTGNPPACQANFTYVINGNNVTFTNTSTGGNSPLYTWYFGDASSPSNLINPIHTYPGPGTYTVCLYMQDSTCFDSTCQVITIVPSSVNDLTNNILDFQCFPNPTKDLANILLVLEHATELKVEILDLAGRKVAGLFDGKAQGGKLELSFQTSNISAGIYVINVKTQQGNLTQKLTVIQ